MRNHHPTWNSHGQKANTILPYMNIIHYHSKFTPSVANLINYSFSILFIQAYEDNLNYPTYSICLTDKIYFKSEKKVIISFSKASFTFHIF
ncbi:hypothetical protein XELAEV_18022328mg [Xenopus laevis]|uniref:Uncharacterized protein n=1 Tax=Xenopus laevis TaxID=8355 RepID=A0A974D4I6_XENLA|nr:hypothetical protein XELAEV_18022328mg [Xenopus laevis]